MRTEIHPDRIRVIVQPLPELPPERKLGRFLRFDPSVLTLGVVLALALMAWMI
jgi:hypothetical protein